MMIASEIDSCEAVYALLSDKLAIFFSFFSIIYIFSDVGSNTS